MIALLEGDVKAWPYLLHRVLSIGRGRYTKGVEDVTSILWSISHRGKQDSNAPTMAMFKIGEYK